VAYFLGHPVCMGLISTFDLFRVDKCLAYYVDIEICRLCIAGMPSRDNVILYGRPTIDRIIEKKTSTPPPK